MKKSFHRLFGRILLVLSLAAILSIPAVAAEPTDALTAAAAQGYLEQLKKEATNISNAASGSGKTYTPIAFVDVTGDGMPELIYIAKDPGESWATNLYIYTAAKDGSLLKIYEHLFYGEVQTQPCGSLFQHSDGALYFYYTTGVMDDPNGIQRYETYSRLNYDGSKITEAVTLRYELIMDDPFDFEGIENRYENGQKVSSSSYGTAVSRLFNSFNEEFFGNNYASSSARNNEHFSAWAILGVGYDFACERLAEKSNNAAPASTAVWYDEYTYFLLSHKYKTTGQTYYNDQKIEAALYDMDRDGIPELIIKNGAPSMAQSTCYVYTFKNGRISYIDNVGSRMCDLSYLENTDYHGLFCYDGVGGSYSEYYFDIVNDHTQTEWVYEDEIENGVLLSHERRTNDLTLFSLAENGSRRWLEMYNVLEITSEFEGGTSRDFVIGFLNYRDASFIFSDVPASSYYKDCVNWAIRDKITNGTSDNTFSPDATCTTAQILTFLWRTSGSPEPTILNPFSDVKSSDYYYNAALWASEKGLVSGAMFNGGEPCKRSSVVTYLWKLSGSPSEGGSSFSDVPEGASYAQAASWAVSKNITNGTGNNQFSPNATCTRGQIVTFLYRYANTGGNYSK